jgi:hypothetical protein
MAMKRFWIELEIEDPSYMHLAAGCGVTARDREEALGLVREFLFSGGSLPPVRRIIENVDISQLDPLHVRPNMGTPLRYGIWFPMVSGR